MIDATKLPKGPSTLYWIVGRVHLIQAKFREIKWNRISVYVNHFTIFFDIDSSHCTLQSGKMKNLVSTIKYFIKLFVVISFVKTLLSRNFGQNVRDWIKSQQFPNDSAHCTVWKLRKFTLTLLWQKFCNFHTVHRVCSFFTEKIFRQTNSLVIPLLVKTLLSRNFCQKSVTVKCANQIVHWNMEITIILSHTFKKIVNATFLLGKVVNSWFHEREFIVLPHCTV